MKNKGKIFIGFTLIFLLLSTSFIQGQLSSRNGTTERNIQTQERSRQDGSVLTKLQWYAPKGVLPGTYNEYLKNHPLTPAQFATPNMIDSGNPQNYTLGILVNSLLYPFIKNSLTQYLADLELEEYTVFLQTVIGGTPEEIKEWINERFTSGARGIVFIGSIQAAWVDISGEVFPSDLFYMDLNGNWQDINQDGVYESHDAGTGDMAPEVYVGRIDASSLSYDSEAAMVNAYFAKVHAYRTGILTQPWHGLEYVEEDWYDMDVNLNLIYGMNVSRYDYGYFTTAEDYLHQMSLGQHFVQVCVHSYSGGHYFSTRPTESTSYAHVYVYSPSNRPGRLFVGSDDGIKVWFNGINVLTQDRYGGWTEDQFSTNVSLHAGWNTMLSKISQEGGDYKFSVKITDINDTTFPDLLYQVNDPAIHGAEAPFIRSFLLNGFHQDISDNFWDYLTTDYLGVDESALDPHAGDVTNGTAWATYDSGNPFINLGEYCDNPEYGVCYAFARAYAPAQTSCQLWMGYDDGARVWLNGNEIVYDNRYGGFQADMKKVNVTLLAGENRLLIKLSQWMGDYGFSARLCTATGGAIEGLAYDPEFMPITHIGTWLINGPYVNPDKATRLSTNYLGNEENITPDENMSAPFGSWKQGIGNGCPFDLALFFDHGAWVLSQDIQDHDPLVLFYNLFACGPGRFTDGNYLAGSYIFDTTYGLLTIASSKSGSMLNFDDFTKPLSEGKSVGEAFHRWFDVQAPFVLWEQEWYYGLVALGDPTLCVVTPVQMKISKPENGVYFGDKKILPFPSPLCLGKITIESSVQSMTFPIERVEFYVDDVLQETITAEPYSWTWSHPAFFKHIVKIIAYDTAGHTATREISIRKFF